jgi:Sulfotransferase family
MAVHYIHISKSGGTALRHAIREGRHARGGKPFRTPWGPLWTHRHSFRLRDLPKGHKAILTLRDPVARFLSGYHSRLRKGAPRYLEEWSDAERQSFEWFPTPQELADALAEPPGELRARAEFAMSSIRHLKRHQISWTGTPAYFRRHLDSVLYIARQETLDEDWERLKELLELPSELALPRDEVAAHRNIYPDDRSLSERGEAAVRAWYSRDYEVLEIGEHVRHGRVPPPGSPLERLALLIRSPMLAKLRSPGS